MKIVLIGYMASGKSTIGKILAKELNLSFIDLDHYISDREQMSIPEIFTQKGEIYFRKIETKYLLEVLKKEQEFILSLGGGTPCYGNNMEIILNSDAASVYLKASIPTITERIRTGKRKRPLVAHLSNEELPEFIGKHLFERQFYYLQSNHSITVDGKQKYEIVDDLLKALC
ncbi:MAG: shikimate kinase [Polaribacter sp.]